MTYDSQNLALAALAKNSASAKIPRKAYEFRLSSRQNGFSTFFIYYSL